MVVWFLLDVFLFVKDYKAYTERRQRPNFGYFLINPRGYFIDDFDIAYRPQVGTQYKKTPITLFGCSFAYGQYLDETEIFSAVLSEKLKRPVYNRAFPGWGLQHMYFQVKETDKTDFYKTVPYSDTVIYILMYDHYYRALIKGSYDTLDDSFYIHYKYNKNKKELKLDNFKNIFLNLLKSSYLFKFINENHAYKFIDNPNNKDYLTDFELCYFIETRKELEKNWKKPFKFIVFIYDYPTEADPGNNVLKYEDLLIKKLKEHGFIVVTTGDLTDIDLSTEEYRQDNDHPTAKAWQLLTPLFIEKLNL